MTTSVQFQRNSWAKKYAKAHLKSDSGIVEPVYYLPDGAPDREIRLVEINKETTQEEVSLEPIDFGMDRGMDSEHKLLVLDVTPNQWTQIQDGRLKLPAGWSLHKIVEIKG